MSKEIWKRSKRSEIQLLVCTTSWSRVVSMRLSQWLWLRRHCLDLVSKSFGSHREILHSRARERFSMSKAAQSFVRGLQTLVSAPYLLAMKSVTSVSTQLHLGATPTISIHRAQLKPCAPLIETGGSQGSADQDVSFFNFGGGYFGTTAFLLDGAWDSIGSWGGVIYVPSPDNVQEFKVQQHSFTPDSRLIRRMLQPPTVSGRALDAR